MLLARWIEHTLQPKFELGTSKGPIGTRVVWYLIEWNSERPEICGIGEAALCPGHSKEFPAEVKTKLVELCADTTNWEARLEDDLIHVPSVRFAVEQLSLIHISEPTRLLSTSYAVFCLKKKKTITTNLYIQIYMTLSTE